MILRAVVAAYLSEAEPASSATVSHWLPVALSTASIRNTMADLSALGLIEKRHASAGRVPTVEGIRVFLDQLIELVDLPDYDRRTLRNESEEVPADAILSWVSELLSERTRQLGFTVSPRIYHTRIRHISFVRVVSDKLLVVLVPDVGPLRQRLIDEPGFRDQAELDAMAAHLNERLSGQTLSELRTGLEAELRNLRSEMQGLLARSVVLGLRALDSPQDDAQEVVITTRSVLFDHPEFKDPDRLQQILATVEVNERMLAVLGRVQSAPERLVSVSLGEDLEEPALRDCALVAIPYGVSARPVGRVNSELGMLGVIGTHRMDYARVIPMVSFCSHLVSNKLNWGPDRALGE